MQLGLISGDLMLVARLQGAATKLGWQLVTAPSAAAADQWKRSDLAAVVVDLRCVGPAIAELAATWRATPPSPPLVACGPHVQEALLAAARQAGCAAVVTRGQIDHAAESILEATVNAPGT